MRFAHLSLAGVWLLLGGCDPSGQMLTAKATDPAEAQHAMHGCGISPDRLAWGVTADGAFTLSRKAVDAPPIPDRQLACLSRWASDKRVKLAFTKREVTDPADSTATQTETAAPPALQLAGRVTDAAGVLSPDVEARLADKLARLEQATHHQMVVVTVTSLGGRDIADFTRDLGNEWGIGRKGYKDGVVLLVAPTERLVRIAVGPGLEKRLPDELCQQIIDQRMTPCFRDGDIAGGVEAGTDTLIDHLS